MIRGWMMAAIGLITVATGTQLPAAPRYYLIGNSLTWDTRPELLDGDKQWHVDCGVPLPVIAKKTEPPCVKSSTLWPQALTNGSYSFISVQPHYGSTLAQDVETISAWMKLQPQAVFVIHTGWARHAQAADEFASYTAPDAMTHSPIYVRALIAELRRLHPGREIRQTLAQNLLAQIAADSAAGKAPLANVAALYRDEIHLTHEHGRYLAHNAMRRALGQPHSASGFDNTQPELKAYLDGILAWLDTSVDDRRRLEQILAVDPQTERTALVALLVDPRLQQHVRGLLSEIEQAAKARRAEQPIVAEIEQRGGKVIRVPTGPQWLYLALHDSGVEVFDAPATIDLYNGNNPLKGKGGRNEQVTDAWLARLAPLTTVQRLDLSNCAIQGPGLEHVGRLATLKELNLTLTPVTDEHLRHLSSLTELRSLGLASTQCTGTGFTHLRALQKLASVNFHFTPLNDAGLAAIAQVPITDRLWFAHTKFTDAGAPALAQLTRLKRCGIGSADKASSGEAVAALVQLPLEDLALLDNQATPVGLAHAAKIVTLKKLDASHAPTVTDESLGVIARLPLLEEFKLGSAQVTDAGLLELASSSSLKRLTLSGLKRVTPAGIDKLRQMRPEWAIDTR